MIRRNFDVSCDRCGANLGIAMKTMREARSVAKLRRWVRTGGKDYCRNCINTGTGAATGRDGEGKTPAAVAPSTTTTRGNPT